MSTTSQTGVTTTFAYDAFQREVSQTDGRGNTTRTVYDSLCRVSSTIDALGYATDYGYDALGRQISVTDPLTNTVYTAYDSEGHVVSQRGATYPVDYAYDDFGSLINETVRSDDTLVVVTNTIERFCDNFGRSLGYALNGARQSTLAYDPATGRLASMLANGSDVPFTWNYLPGSDLKSSLAYPNGLSASWTCDAKGQLLQVRNATPTNVISQYDYTYDSAGRRIARAHSGTVFAQRDAIEYAYNTKSELTNAVAVADANYTYAYDFDEIGNRDWSSERGANTTYVANNLNQYTSVDDFTPLFDTDGNQTLVKTATGIWQVTYNGENRPILWTCGDTNIVMSYDRIGRRVTKNDQRFVYDGYLQIANHRTTTTTSNYNYQSTDNNLYLICENSVFSFYDRLGLVPEIVEHEPGEAPPGGWSNDINVAETHLRSSMFVINFTNCQDGKVKVKPSFGEIRIDIYFRTIADVVQYREDEFDHVKCYISFRNAVYMIMGVLNLLPCVCPDKASKIAQDAIEMYDHAVRKCAECNKKFDGPGGAHRHHEH